MINKKYLKLLRSKNNSRLENFIYKAISRRIIDSLDLLKTRFDSILELGINENHTMYYLNKRFPNANFTRTDIHIPSLSKKNNVSIIEQNIDDYTLKNSQFDLIYSNFYCHLVDDFQKLLKNINSGLKKEGFFIASLPDRDNIYQLVNSMYRSDLLSYKGAYQRINPTQNIDHILQILKQLNFDAPTIYSDNIKIEYSEFKKLLLDIKEMGLSYSHFDKKRTFEKKNYFKLIESHYKQDYFDNNYVLDIKFNLISAWKK